MCGGGDTAIVVAVEDAPEEGLDQPLRLDKLANEVWGVWWCVESGSYTCCAHFRSG